MPGINPEHEIALAEYQSLIQLATYEGSEYWSRFGYLFTVNAAVLSAIAAILGLSTGRALSIAFGVIAISSLAGFVVCTAWLFMAFRSHALQQIWHNRINMIEKSKLFEASSYLKAFETMHDSFDSMRGLYIYRRVS